MKPMICKVTRYSILLWFLVLAGCDQITNHGTKMFVSTIDGSELLCAPLSPAPVPNIRWMACEISVKEIDRSVINHGTVQLWMKDMGQINEKESYTILPHILSDSRSITYQVSEGRLKVILANFQSHEISGFKLVIFKRIRFQQ